MVFDHDAGMFVSCLDRVDSHYGQESQRRPVTHCQAVSNIVGLMPAASNMIHFGLLYMRALQWWFKTKGFSPRGNPRRTIKVTRRCLRALDMWRKPWFLSQAPVLGAPCCRVTLATDASLTGWGAVMSGHPARCLWNGHFRPDLRNHHVLVCTDQRWFLISTTREVCVRAPYTSWRTRSLGGPRKSSSC